MLSIDEIIHILSFLDITEYGYLADRLFKDSDKVKKYWIKCSKIEVIKTKEYIEYLTNGKLHRLDGPAKEWANGAKWWYVNDKLHRLNEPACEWADGGKFWYVNDKLHRTDGPAREWEDGTKYWYIENKKLTEEEFKKHQLSVV